MGRARVSSSQWLKTHKEMRAWQKTDSFVKWRKRQFLKQGGTCYYCHEPLAGRRQNIEHVIPKSLGGDNRRSNLVIACSACNKDKNTKLLTYKERQALREVNRPYGGTYHRIQYMFETEEALAYRLRMMFRED